MKGHYWNKVSLIELLENKFQQYQDRTAVIYEGNSLTYRALNNRANHLAKKLRNKGIVPNDIVAICSERSLHLMVGILAIMKAGGVYLPIEATTPLERVEYMLRNSNAKLFLTYKKYQEKTSSFIPSIFLDEEINEEECENPRPCLTTPNDPLYAIYTSGTTGLPKGTVLRNNSFVNLIEWYTEEIKLDKDETTLVYTPVSFDATQKSIFSPLLTGGRLLLASSDPYDPSVILKYIQDYQVNHIIATPSSFYPILYLAEKERFETLRSLRILSLNGETINIKNLKNWLRSYNCNATVYNLYGPSECADISIARKLNPYPLLRDDEGTIIGRPIPNVNAYVLNESGQLADIGEIGELYLGGICVGNGYFDKSLNKGKFVPNPFNENEIIYKTGDLVRILEDGNIQYIGRVDNQVKIRGQRVELEEIENVALRYPGILQCTVTFDSDKNCLTLYYFSKEILNPEEIRSFLKNKLSGYSVPSFLYQVSKIPLNKNGKVDRPSLPKYIIKTETKKEEEWSELELKIKEVWKEVIYTDVKKDDIFFHVGGDSLSAYVILNGLYDVFKVKITMKEFYENPTISGLSKLIKEKLSQGASEEPKKNLEQIGANIARTLSEVDLQQIKLKYQEINQNLFETVINSNIRHEYSFPYFRKSKHGFKGKKSDIYHFVYEVVLDNTSVQEIQMMFNKLLESQVLLRTTLKEQGKEFICNEYSYSPANIDFIDISAYDEESQKKIEKLLLNEMKDSIYQNWENPQLYYRMCLLKINVTKYKLLFVFEHLISDTETGRILNEYFKSPSYSSSIVQTDDFRLFLEEIYRLNKDEKLTKYKDSSQYRSLRNEIELFYQKNPSYKKGNPIILSSPKILEIDMRTIDRKVGNIPMHYFLYICTNLLSIAFKLKKIPIRIFVNKRNYGKLNFYNTIGDFSETIPVVFDAELQSGELYYLQYKENNDYLTNNKIALKSFRDDPEIFNVIYLSCPFTYNFLGELTDEEDRYYKENASNFHSLPYPILGYCKENQMTIIINNGLKMEEVEEFEQFLKSLKISYKLTNKE
ncbi:surfactin synthase subunit 2 [Thermoanaerobacter kivui]|uniref:Surfactin synthase subunit 2 n=1 Tax=Thermoanaerobacter kivui TaxID=2325 RepID=A0A097AQR8_THEKI|nr:non-ribosomal peptide synthetase [Thermoanaerobacter kivui]AIS52132.1 surfactin synthase subunit 2 [Thermoanaerobacter kivui]